MTTATENSAGITVQLLSATGPKDAVYALLRQLRPAYSQKAMSEQINKQQSQGYQLAYVERHGEVVAVAGFYIGEKLAWGKHLYVDDLVTSDQHRSRQQNIDEVRERLREAVYAALRPPRPRKETRPTRASKRRRLQSKKRRGDKKKLRGKVKKGDW